MHKILHPRDDVERLYESRKEEGRGLASIKDRFYAPIQRLDDYIQKRGERLIEPPDTILTTRGQTEWQLLENKKSAGKTILWMF